MSIKIMPAITKDFTLEMSDEVFNEEGEPPTTLTVRQASQGEHERRGQLFAKWITSTKLDGTNNFEREFNYQQLKRLEVFLTLVDCNLTNGSTGKPQFTFKNGRLDSRPAFDVAWDDLPVMIADEIHDKVLETNPDWSLSLGE
jgi:hypothetical protein